MKTATIRVIALILCVAIVFGFAATFVLFPSEKKKENLPANAIGWTPETVIIKFDGADDVLADEYVYYALAARSGFEAENGGTGVWEAYDFLSDSFLTQIDNMLIQANVYIAWGKDEGFELSEEDMAEIETRVNDLKAQAETKGISFEEFLKEGNLTEELFRRGCYRESYVSKFQYDFMTLDNPAIQVSEEDVDNFIKEKGVLGAKHILVKNDEGEDVEENRKAAESILERIKNGEDFDELMKELSEDGGLEGSPNGYTFATGQFVPEFEDMTKVLEIGEVSEIVESEFGYHIIKRIEIDRSEAKAMAQDAKYKAKLDEYMTKLNPVKTEAREAIKIQDILPVL